jgi:hypothetical protein
MNGSRRERQRSLSLIHSVLCSPSTHYWASIMGTVLAWRVRQVRGGQDAERFVVEFLPTKFALSDSGDILWEGDGMERNEAQGRAYAASLGVSADAFQYGVAQARATFVRLSE